MAKIQQLMLQRVEWLEGPKSGTARGTFFVRCENGPPGVRIPVEIAAVAGDPTTSARLWDAFRHMFPDFPKVPDATCSDLRADPRLDRAGLRRDAC